ncbi:MAG: exported protein of unknown function [Firmicutes bacterium]|nr:exported protein of unknown function [Bacillota bacterium]
MSFVLTGVVESTGSANAGNIPVLGATGVLDTSVLPSVALAGVPTGAVQAFAMTTVPSGWLACDGSTVSRTDYAELFALIGTAFGEGDGSTTFALPSLHDNFILGLGTTYATIAATGGEATHTLTTDEMPAHTHKLGAARYSVASGGTPNGIAMTSDTAVTDSTGGGGAHNNMPPYIVLKYCIKY